MTVFHFKEMLTGSAFLMTLEIQPKLQIDHATID
jgi:hypothetical protein